MSNLELIDEPDDYHTNYLSGISHSMLNTFRKSITDFHRKYVLNKWDNSRVAAFDFGTAFHAYCLERDLFWEKVAVKPAHDKRSKANKEAWELWEQENRKKAWVSASEMEAVEAMAESVMNDTEASRWVFGLKGINEKMIAWKSDGTETNGVRCSLKCKPDRYLPASDNPYLDGTDVVVDLKTTNSVTPEEIAKSASAFGYHCQAALYCMGAAALSGRPARHISVFIAKKPPYEVATVEYSAKALEIGKEMNAETILEMADCMSYDKFTGRMANKLTTLDLPPWFYSQWARRKESSD